MKIKGILGKYNIVGTVYVLTKKNQIEKLEEKIYENIDEMLSGTLKPEEEK